MGFNITSEINEGQIVGTFTNGSVLFSGSTGLITQSNTDFFYTSSTKMLSIDSVGATTALHTGPAAGTSNLVVGGSGIEIIGTNNTSGGMNIVFGNKSAGVNAFTSLFFQNDLADTTGTHYGNLGLNSSTYTDTFFGTAFSNPNQLAMFGTDGPTTVGTTKSGSFVNFIVGGSSSTNEMGRFTTTGLTVGLAGTLTGVITLAGATSGSIKIQGQAVGGSSVLTLPAATDTLVGLSTTDILTNKTLVAPVLGTATATKITISAGTATVSPFNLTSGTNLTTAVAGAFEYDGVQMYSTIDTSSGRGALPVEQYFHLTSAGSTISTIANFFGTTSNIALVASAYYVVDIYMWFLNSTAGTVTWTLTNSAAPTSQNVYYEESPITGIVAPPGTATMLVGQLYNDATAALAITSGTITDATNNFCHMKIFLKNGTGTSLKIQATKNVGGTITPGINSWWIARRMSPNNIGTFIS